MLACLVLARRIFDCIHDYSYQEREGDTVCFHLYPRPSFSFDNTAVIKLNNRTSVPYAENRCIQSRAVVKFINITQGADYCIHLLFYESKQIAWLTFRERSAIARVYGGIHFETASLLIQGKQYPSSRIVSLPEVDLLFFDELRPVQGIEDLIGETVDGEFANVLVEPFPQQHNGIELELSGHARLYTASQEISNFNVDICDMNTFIEHFDVEDARQLSALRKIIQGGDFFRAYAVSEDFCGLITDFEVLDDRIRYNRSVGCVTVEEHQGTLYSLCGSTVSQQTSFSFCGCSDFRAALIESNGRYRFYNAELLDNVSQKNYTTMATFGMLFFFLTYSLLFGLFYHVHQQRDQKISIQITS